MNIQEEQGRFVKNCDKKILKKIQKNQKLFAKSKRNPKNTKMQIHSEKNSKRCGQYIMSMYADGPEKNHKKIIVTYKRKKEKIFRYFNPRVELPL